MLPINLLGEEGDRVGASLVESPESRADGLPHHEIAARSTRAMLARTARQAARGTLCLPVFPAVRPANSVRWCSTARRRRRRRRQFCVRSAARVDVARDAECRPAAPLLRLEPRRRVPRQAQDPSRPQGQPRQEGSARQGTRTVPARPRPRLRPGQRTALERQPLEADPPPQGRGLGRSCDRGRQLQHRLGRRCRHFLCRGGHEGLHAPAVQFWPRRRSRAPALGCPPRDRRAPVHPRRPADLGRVRHVQPVRGRLARRAAEARHPDAYRRLAQRRLEGHRGREHEADRRGVRAGPGRHGFPRGAGCVLRPCPSHSELLSDSPPSPQPRS